MSYSKVSTRLPMQFSRRNILAAPVSFNSKISLVMTRPTHMFTAKNVKPVIDATRIPAFFSRSLATTYMGGIQRHMMMSSTAPTQ
jgi:hypothetical protein